MTDMTTIDDYELVKQRLADLSNPDDYSDPAEMPSGAAIERAGRWLDELHGLTPIPRCAVSGGTNGEEITFYWRLGRRYVSVFVLPDSVQVYHQDGAQYDLEHAVAPAEVVCWLDWYKETL